MGSGAETAEDLLQAAERYRNWLNQFTFIEGSAKRGRPKKTSEWLVIKLTAAAWPAMTNSPARAWQERSGQSPSSFILFCCHLLQLLGLQPVSDSAIAKWLREPE